MNNIEHHDTRYSMEGCFMDVIGYTILTGYLERYGHPSSQMLTLN